MILILIINSWSSCWSTNEKCCIQLIGLQDKRRITLEWVCVIEWVCAEIVSFDLITLRLHTHEQRRVSCLNDIKTAFISTILAINMIRYNVFQTFFTFNKNSNIQFSCNLIPWHCSIVSISSYTYTAQFIKFLFLFDHALY